MTYKTILTFHEAAAPESALEPVIAFTRSLNAHLSIILLELMPPPPIAVGYGGAAFEAWGEDYSRASKRLKDKLEDLMQWMQASSTVPDLPFNIDVEYDQAGALERKLGQRARYADMAVISGKYNEDDPILQQVLKGALFDTGRPVLSLNGQNILASDLKRILIAWDAGAQAAKAVQLALPFLKRAGEVHIAMADPRSGPEGHGAEPGAGIAAYLARHGVNVSIHALAGGGKSVSDTLLQHAVDMDAQLIVMGGYGHNRLQEWLFGSTTNRMLKQAGHPVLLAH